MENDGGRIATTTVASPLPPLSSSSILGDQEIEQKLEAYLRGFRDFIVDSPKSLLIVKNAALTLLEVEGQVDDKSLFLLVEDKEFREGIVNRLSSETPRYWDETWNKAWTKEIDPLYSNQQQRIARRRSLISFWTKEWDTLPEDQVKRVASALRALT